MRPRVVIPPFAEHESTTVVLILQSGVLKYKASISWDAMSDEDLDWDDDFDFGDGAELKPRQGDGGSGQVVLSGVAANPDEEENWDDDFDLDVQAGGSGKEST